MNHLISSSTERAVYYKKIRHEERVSESFYLLLTNNNKARFFSRSLILEQIKRTCAKLYQFFI